MERDAVPLRNLPPHTPRPTDQHVDALREKCGVFASSAIPTPPPSPRSGSALQHAAGSRRIVSFDGGRFHSERRLGLVGGHFSAAT